MKNNCFHRNWI